MRKIAISDIHGHLLTFKALLDKLQLKQEDQLYLLGDYIDRGPDSKGVIDHILKLQQSGYSVHCLKGNHEDMLLKARTDLHWRKVWLGNGGWTTLHSFEIQIDLLEIPKMYWEFLEKLASYHATEGFLFVHAGLNFSHKDPLSDENDLLWIRNWHRNIDFQWLGERRIVHGHTPMPKFVIEKMHQLLAKRQVLNIDAGCFVYRQLCGYDITNNRLYFQEKID